MKYDISLTMPAIRVNNWVEFYKSAKESCKHHSFELVLVSPFELPEELKGISNIQHISDRGNPSRATQIANISANGKLIMNCVDDGVFFNNALDWAIDFFNGICKEHDIINMRYREGVNRQGGTLPQGYWTPYYHGELQRPGIDPFWSLAMHFIMNKSTYMKYGGIDCNFEYSNHGIHDLIFRLQSAGSVVYHSHVEGLNCNHYPGESVDHSVIYQAQTFHDAPRFVSIYNNPRAAYERQYLDINNWKEQPAIWDRRFPASKEIKKYEDLL